MQTPLARRLTLVLAVIYAVMATLEVVLRLEDPDFGAMAFLAGTLAAGAALMFLGLFGPVPDKARVPVIMLGVVTGLIATVWTVVVPILATAIVVLTIRGDGRTDVPTPD